jgi:hypothetical protein
MRMPLYIIRFTMLNRETLYRAARYNRGRRAQSLCDGGTHSIEKRDAPFTGD